MLMSGVSGASAPLKTSKRKNTFRACEECRRRRAKCNGQRPSCARCIERNLICKYTSEDDGRQPAPKSYVLLLRQRIDLLERTLRIHGIDVEASGAHLATTTASPSSALRLSNAPVTSLVGTTVNANDLNPDVVEELSSAFEGALSLDDSVNFDEDGEHHYFGPTSGRLEFLQNPDGVEKPRRRIDKPSTQSGRYKAATEPSVGRALNSNPIPNELRRHLEDLYFMWENPWYQMVSRPLYKESEHVGGRYFSPLLLYCILAMGSRFSDRPEIRTDWNDPKTAGKVFLDKIEVLLQQDLKSPTLTTIQSLAILCGVYIANGSDAVGWLYQGMANSLALDMGLNIDPGGLVEGGTMSLAEVQLRRRMYWALYCTDKLAASYTGRVCTMLDSQSAVMLPNLINEHVSDCPVSPGKCPGETDLLQLQLGLIKICHILEKIFLTLYAPKPLLQGMKAATFLHSCLLELKNWWYDLPSGLKIDRDGKHLPQVYTLHMVYQTAKILLGKYFSSQRSTQSSSSARPGQHRAIFEPEIIDKARITCRDAAKEICAVATKYRQVFGSFRRSPITATHCTLSAAIVLLGPKHTEDNLGTVDHTSVEVCLDVLEELSESWWPAHRIHHRIQILAQDKLNATPGKHWAAAAEVLPRRDPLQDTIAFPSGALGSDAQHLDPKALDISAKTQEVMWAGLVEIDAYHSAELEWTGTDFTMTDLDDSSIFFPMGNLSPDYPNFNSWFQMPYSDS